VLRGSLLALVLVLGAGPAALAAAAPTSPATRVWPISYRAWDGRSRHAYVVLPSWYGPRDDPPIPLVISPHGRGVEARDNVHFWGDLPAVGRFAVVNPEGQGRRLTLYSWGDPGEIADLGRMPAIVRRALPWLHVDARRTYAIGGSMGGQETLLLVARDRLRLAGAISFDADTDMALRYRDFARVPGERHLQCLARSEIGGTPAADPAAFRSRSPLDQAGAIAASGVPLEIWWSTRDRIVIHQSQNSAALYRRIVAHDPRAPVLGVVGTWPHTAEMWYFRRLPAALATMGLLPLRDAHPFPRLPSPRLVEERTPSDRMIAVHPREGSFGRGPDDRAGAAFVHVLAARPDGAAAVASHACRRR
jgi:hypothetical protein